jgi:internalin A
VNISSVKLLIFLFAFLLVTNGFDLFADNQKAENDRVVKFQDPNLEAAIREHIGKFEGNIIASDVDTITSFKLSSGPIANLSGIESMQSLRRLDLGSSYMHISGPDTGEAYEWGYKIEETDSSSLPEITVLKPRPKVVTTVEYWNRINDLTPMSNLKRLRYLNLIQNQVHDLEPINDLTSLDTLLLGRNKIHDIAPLSGLTQLTRLDLSGNEVGDWSPLQNLKKLKSLGLVHTHIRDLTSISHLYSLENLSASNNEISEISPLSALTNLQSLYLSDNQIRDLSPLSTLLNLSDLGLTANEIKDIRPLMQLSSLETLYLGRNEISSLPKLDGLSSLRWLDGWIFNIIGYPIFQS